MDVLNTYLPLQEEVVYHSLEGKVLVILSNGTEGAWLIQKNGEYVWDSGCYFHFDVLKRYESIRKAMIGKLFILSFDGRLFKAELCFKQRIGGYKEPMENVCLNFAKERSIIQVLNMLNKKLNKQKSCISDDFLKEKSVIDFNAYKLTKKL